MSQRERLIPKISTKNPLTSITFGIIFGLIIAVPLGFTEEFSNYQIQFVQFVFEENNPEPKMNSNKKTDYYSEPEKELEPNEDLRPFVLGDIGRIMSIDVDNEGNIYALDTYNKIIKKYDSDGNLLFEINLIDLWGKDQTNPFDVNVDSNHNIFVLDQRRLNVQQFDKDGNFDSIFAHSLQRVPIDMDIDEYDNVHVIVRYANSDGASGFLYKFDPSGTLSLFKEIGFAESIAVDKSGNIYFSEFIEDDIPNHHQIKKLDSEGNFILEFSTGGRALGEILGVYGMGFDSNDNLIIAEHHNKRIQIFDPEGNFVNSFGLSGKGIGEFGRLNDISIGNEGTIYVADGADNNRIQVFPKNILPKLIIEK